MTRRHSTPIGLGAVLVLVAALLVPIHAAGPQRGGPTVSADVQAAQALLVLAYPELLDRPVTFRFVATDGGLRVRVAEAVDPLAAPAGEAQPDLVEVVVEFGSDGQLARFRAEGALVSSPARDALSAAMQAHPRWTEEERDTRLAALHAAHPRGGPFDVRLDVARWARFLGANAHAAAAAFDWGATGPPDSPSDGPRWVAHLTSTGTGGRPAQYRLDFEPLGGRLVAITRQ